MARKATYKRKLTEQMQSMGTWREEYAATIDACAKIMERRDELLRQYKDEGNLARTPEGKKSATLQAIEANERNLLSYLRALGLTPDTVRRMEKQAAGKPCESSPMDALAGIIAGLDDE